MHICVHKILIFTNYVDFDKFLLTSRSRRRRLYSVYESLSWDARVLLSSPSLSVLSDKWPRHVSFSSCVPSSPLWRCRFLSSLYLVTLASLPWSGVEWEPRLSSLLKFSCTFKFIQQSISPLPRLPPVPARASPSVSPTAGSSIWNDNRCSAVEASALWEG